MKTGIIYDEPFAEYLASDAVGSGKLDDLRPRPLVYFQRWVSRTMPPRKSTDALAFGRLFHCLALEGETAMSERYFTLPDEAPEDLRRFRNAKKKSEATVGSIAWWDEIDARRGSRELVTAESVALAWKMVGAIRAKKAAVELLARGKPEVTFRHQLAAFAVQARVDWYDGEHSAGPLLINVKTVESLDDFDDQYYKFGYYKGDAFYRLVAAKELGVPTTVPQMLNLVSEKNHPFECELRAPDSEALSIGTDEVMADLRLLRQCYESGVWPGAAEEARTVSLPEWYVKRATAEGRAAA